MKCITITQPYASFIAWGEKRIETRHWQTRHRGQIAIHAARFTPEVHDACADELMASLMAARGIYSCRSLPYGAIVATATLTDCVHMAASRLMSGRFVTGGKWRELTEQERALGYYEPGRYAWILVDVQPLPEPIPCRGFPGVWDVDIEGGRVVNASGAFGRAA